MAVPHSLQSKPPTTSDYHVVIIGAGWYGLVAAKTYLQLYPSISLLVLDADTSVGGVWSQSRIYPRLVVNQPTPMFEYPDFSMKEALGVSEWSDITGEMMAEYLELYAKKFRVWERCRFGTEVVKVEREGDNGSWVVRVRPTGSGSEVVGEELKCKKLIMATGRTSAPKLPDNIDTSLYTGKTLHAKEIGKRYHDLLKDEDIKSITVIGGNKSSFEFAGMFALEGKKVNWLIRDEGTGPGFLLKDRPDGKKHMIEGKTMRAPSALAPSYYHPQRWITRFLYSGKFWLCNLFLDWFFKAIIKADMERYNTPNRKLIKPLSDSMFWVSAGLSQYHCGDEAIFNLIDEGRLVTISRTKVTSMKGRTLSLSNGTNIQSDAVIFATGWQQAYSSIFDPSMAVDLGLPVPLSVQPAESCQYWERLDKPAEERVLSLYPILRKPPTYLNLSAKPAKAKTPLRHFRLLAPSAFAARNDRSIVFLGNIVTADTASFAAISALWSIAYMEDLFESSNQKGIPAKTSISSILNDKGSMDHEIAASNAYFKLRYLDVIDVPLSIFEVREVIDRFLLDLGIRADRKGMLVKGGRGGWKAWMKEWFEPYIPADYSGIVEEFAESRGKTLDGLKRSIHS